MKEGTVLVFAGKVKEVKKAIDLIQTEQKVMV